MKVQIKITVAIIGVLMSLSKGALGGWTCWRTTDNDYHDKISGPGLHNLRVDNLGNSYLVWEGWPLDNSQLFFATNRSGVWVDTQLTYSPIFNRDPSIAVESDGIVHITWVGTPSDDYIHQIFYGTNATGAWADTQLTNTVCWNTFPSIDIEVDGTVHLVWLGNPSGDYETDEVFYATNSAGAWVDTQLTATNYDHADPTIAVDIDGNVHLAWVAEPIGQIDQIFYATNHSGAWVDTQLTTDTTGPAIYKFGTSMAIDSKGAVHIAWASGCDFQIIYANNVTGAWVDTQLTDFGVNGIPSIAVDPDDNVHLTWSHIDLYKEYFQIIYATNRSGSWVETQLTQTNCNNLSANLAVDCSSYVHIGYMAGPPEVGDSTEIYYLTNDPGESGVEERDGPRVLPTQFQLSQNYPNPFNATTVIRYSTPDGKRRPQHTTLKVYNITGQLVRTLVDGPQMPGYHTASWDGRDDAGRDVASGVYLYQLEIGSLLKARRMVLLR